MSKDNKDYRPVHFGGKGGGEHFRDHWNRDSYDKRHGMDRARYSGKDGSTGGFDVFKENADERYEMDRATAAATGSWVTNINKHTKKLYEEDGLDYNDMRKYADAAGIIDIGSKEDVKGIRDQIDKMYTSQDQLEAYVDKILNKKKGEQGTTDPGADMKPIEHSPEVAAALERSGGRGGNPNSDSFFKKMDNDVADDAAAAKTGTDQANQETNSFLSKYKLDLKGSLKPSRPVREPITPLFTN